MQQQGELIAQAAAIPYRRREDGALEVLLIRRTDGGPWGIPKGHVDPGLDHRGAAEMEALEEAGVQGVLSEEPVGGFEYEKLGRSYTVTVYTLHVSIISDHWKEQRLRERKWFEAQAAAEQVGRAAVGRIIRRAAEALRGTGF